MTVGLRETNLSLPGQIGEPYHGKVGDVYTLDHEAGELLAVVRTDRLSAFDVILDETIPHKGQVLNQMSAELLTDAQPFAPNWLLDVPDPNVSIGYKAEPFKVEMIVRGFLLGNSWRAYRDGERNLCGHILPGGMAEFQPFDTPLVTPTTKAETHDENITPDYIVAQGLATADEYEEMAGMALTLFAEGQRAATEKDLLLADTKYEFGRLASGGIVVIDEVHTPDSSRYFPSDEYAAYLNLETLRRPTQLSKEFVREWLAEEHGYLGQVDRDVPHLPDTFVREVSRRYIALYERMLGRPFEPAPAANDAELQERIHTNIVGSLGTFD